MCHARHEVKPPRRSTVAQQSLNGQPSEQSRKKPQRGQRSLQPRSTISALQPGQVRCACSNRLGPGGRRPFVVADVLTVPASIGSGIRLLCRGKRGRTAVGAVDDPAGLWSGTSIDGCKRPGSTLVCAADPGSVAVPDEIEVLVDEVRSWRERTGCLQQGRCAKERQPITVRLLTLSSPRNSFRCQRPRGVQSKNHDCVKPTRRWGDLSLNQVRALHA